MLPFRLSRSLRPLSGILGHSKRSFAPFSWSPTPRLTLRGLHTEPPKDGQSGHDKTHFGFQEIPESEKVGRVAEVFHNVADKYDLMNDVMSAGVHRLWKDQFVKTLNPSPGCNVVDVAGGTGDIAFRIADHMHSSRHQSPLAHQREALSVYSPGVISVVDINSSMLRVGMERSAKLGYENLKDPLLTWQTGDAEALPLPSDSQDAYTIAFGIRNCTHIPVVLKEAHRVLKRGGRFLCLEFSHVDNPLLGKLYSAYSFEVIPVLGQLVASDMASYRYLVESIARFPKQDEFLSMIKEAGFKCATYTNLTCGVVAIHSAFKL